MGRKRLLVTGAGGMVGSYVQGVFNDYDLTLTDIIDVHSYLNIEDKASARKLIGQKKPDYVLHLAAATDVDRCEIERERALKTNSEGTRNVAEACKESGAIMIYISTGAVFNGDKESPYVETDQISPLNAYGLSKYEGERVVQSLLDRFYIVRASWMIGGGKNDKKFVGKIVNKIMSGEKHIKVVNDKFGSITYAKDLVRTIKELINTDKFGIYHASNGGMYSRYDIAKEIINILRRYDVELSAVSSDEFPLPAPRGRSEAIENYNLSFMNLNNCMRPWKEALREYITEELLTLYSSSPK